MQAYKCDICGAYYTSNKGNHIGKKAVRLGTSGTWADVCPECTDAIQKVIDQRLGINEKEKN